MKKDIETIKRRREFFREYLNREKKKGRKTSKIVRELAFVYFLSEETIWKDISL